MIEVVLDGRRSQNKDTIKQAIERSELDIKVGEEEEVIKSPLKGVMRDIAKKKSLGND